MLTCVYKNDFFLAISLLILLTLIVVLPFVVGCSKTDNPIVDEDANDGGETFHADADGFVLEVAAAEIYRQFQGTSSGGLTVGVREEVEVHVRKLHYNSFTVTTPTSRQHFRYP